MERESPLAELFAAISDPERFVSASWMGAVRGRTPPAERVTLRPVEIKAGRRLQLSTFDGTTTNVANVEPGELATRLAELFDAGFASAYVRTLDADLQLSHSRAGTPRLVRHRPTRTTIDTAHDRSKPRLLGEDAPFLRVSGITDGHGRIKPTARAKHRQVERFVEILAHTLDDDQQPGRNDDRDGHAGRDRPLRVVDLGCGGGVLTLAAYHWLTEVRGLAVEMTGVDTKAHLVDRLAVAAATLGWDGLRFEAATIAGYAPAEPPDLVLALHACDTATDDALARAVEWRSRCVLAAPCCQHDLQAQIGAAPDGLAPLVRHAILRERLGDLLTDALRAELLRAHGYRTEVIEFVSTEHTPRNVMIRAVLRGRPDPGAAAAAERLAAAWGVTPALAAQIGYRP